MPASDEAVFCAVRAMNRLSGLDLSIGEGQRFLRLVEEATRALASGVSPAALTVEALAARIGINSAMEAP